MLSTTNEVERLEKHGNGSRKTFYLKNQITNVMREPKQLCPRCGVDLGQLLYCTPIEKVKVFCPNCDLKVQMKCPKCDNWIVVIERYCAKCGEKNPGFFQSKRNHR